MTKRVFLGDSITAGWNLSAYFSNYLNYGVPGQTAEDCWEDCFNPAMSQNPEQIHILTGLNSIAHVVNSTPIHIYYMVRSAIEDYEVDPNKIMLGALLPNNLWESTYAVDEPTGKALILSWNTSIEGLATDMGCRYVDYYNLFTNADGTQKAEWYVDQQHPNNEGHRQMAMLLRNYL